MSENIIEEPELEFDESEFAVPMFEEPARFTLRTSDLISGVEWRVVRDWYADKDYLWVGDNAPIPLKGPLWKE